MPDDQWKEKLSPEQYSVCRMKGTEQPFTGKYYKCDEAGTYQCACCGTDLFRSTAKFESGTGWPSFWEPVGENVREEPDTSYGMVRTEVTCKKCGSHLGHVFDDGPRPTGLRYCINSLSLQLRREEQ